MLGQYGATETWPITLDWQRLAMAKPFTTTPLIHFHMSTLCHIWQRLLLRTPKAIKLKSFLVNKVSRSSYFRDSAWLNIARVRPHLMWWSMGRSLESPLEKEELEPRRSPAVWPCDLGCSRMPISPPQAARWPGRPFCGLTGENNQKALCLITNTWTAKVNLHWV